MYRSQLRIDDAVGHTHPDFSAAFGLTVGDKVCSAKVAYNDENLTKTLDILKGKNALVLPCEYLKGEDGNPIPGITFAGPSMVDVITTALAAPAVSVTRGTRTSTAVAAPAKTLTPEEALAQGEALVAKAKQAIADKAKAEQDKADQEFKAAEQKLADLKAEKAKREEAAKNADAEMGRDEIDDKIMGDTTRVFTPSAQRDGEKANKYAARIRAEREAFDLAS
jgi:hypothetical protein